SARTDSQKNPARRGDRFRRALIASSMTSSGKTAPWAAAAASPAWSSRRRSFLKRYMNGRSAMNRPFDTPFDLARCAQRDTFVSSSGGAFSAGTIQKHEGYRVDQTPKSRSPASKFLPDGLDDEAALSSAHDRAKSAVLYLLSERPEAR